MLLKPTRRDLIKYGVGVATYAKMSRAQSLQAIVGDAKHSSGPTVALVTNSIGHAVDNAVTGSVNTTGANLLVCMVSAYTGGPADSLIDSKSNTWTALTSRSNASGFNRITLYYVVSPTVGSGHTFTNNTTGSYTTIAMAAFSGIKTSSTFESENGADNVVYTVAPVTGGAVTPNTSGDLIISVMAWSFSATTATFSVDSGFTITDQYHASGVTEGGAFSYLITNSTSAQNPAWTPSTTGTTAIENAVFAKQ